MKKSTEMKGEEKMKKSTKTVQEEKAYEETHPPNWWKCMIYFNPDTEEVYGQGDFGVVKFFNKTIQEVRFYKMRYEELASLYHKLIVQIMKATGTIRWDEFMSQYPIPISMDSFMQRKLE
jgi:hypothetical protein